MKITHAEVKRRLKYNKKTGAFVWRVPTGKGGWIAAGSRAGTRVIRNGKAYTVVRLAKALLVYAHRLAWFYVKGVWPSKEIDHRNGDGTDNRWRNLRKANRMQQSANSIRPVTNKTGFKGVCNKRKNFQARIKVNQKTIVLGTRTTALEAHALYAKAARKHFGEFARTS